MQRGGTNPNGASLDHLANPTDRRFSFSFFLFFSPSYLRRFGSKGALLLGFSGLSGWHGGTPARSASAGRQECLYPSLHDGLNWTTLKANTCANQQDKPRNLTG